MNLTIDIGNTLTKLAVFNKTVLLHKETIKENLQPAFFETFKKQFPEIKAVLLASVKEKNPALLELLNENFQVLELNAEMKLPVAIKYESPQTLGHDRLAAVVAASARFPQRCVLVLDIGTCITFDFINAEGAYLGGAISPGMDMRFKALNAYTGKLPLIAAEVGFNNLIGTSTAASIRAGVQMGIQRELQAGIDAYALKFPDMAVVLTGGQHEFFAKTLKNPIFAAPDLVLEGLNIILNYNGHY
jgi:type III pantothenate kinase